MTHLEDRLIKTGGGKQFSKIL